MKKPPIHQGCTYAYKKDLVVVVGLRDSGMATVKFSTGPRKGEEILIRASKLNWAARPA